MKPIFNSLGSNYTFIEVISALRHLVISNKKNLSLLRAELSRALSNEVVLCYKGRDAIEFALKTLLPKNSKIITQAFSCYAVEEGIVRAGMTPLYCDVRGEVNGASESWFSTNMDLKSIQKVYKNHPDCKAVLVQHSLGVPADISEISRWCGKNKILLIEDLAQAYGATDDKGNKLGTHSDVIIYSFGRDKIIDAVSGGAVVFTNLNQQTRDIILKLKQQRRPVVKSKVCKDMLYPLATYIIRNTTQFGIGILLFFVLKKLGFLTSPIVSPFADIRELHPSYAALALQKIQKVQKQLTHRKVIAGEYYSLLSKAAVAHFSFNLAKSDIQHASNLRFSLTFHDPLVMKRVMNNLKHEQIHVSDRWYRSPVDFGSLKMESVYVVGSCSNAEYASQRVLNLPTHLGINKNDARRISKNILKTIDLL